MRSRFDEQLDLLNEEMINMSFLTERDGNKFYGKFNNLLK